MPEISIIVPVYKAEKYLKRCIDSIISQSFNDWELLLIDDGSPDNSGAICDEYTQTDKRIKVFHKENGGVASARELGIQNSKGKYSIHVDPDDWIDKNTLEELYVEVKKTNADIIVFDFLLEYGSRSEVLCQKINSSQELLKQLFYQERHGSLCNKLIRTELYKKYDIHFPEKLICWEDLYICCNILMLHPCKVTYIPKAFYHYDFFSNPNSMVRKASLRTLEGMKFFCRYFEDLLPETEKYLLNPTKGLVLVTAYRCKLLSADEIRNTFPEINNWYIKKYLHCYKLVVYCAVAQVLSGKNIKAVVCFQKLNQLYQRIKNKLNK